MITAAMIVRDEQAFLPGCLESLDGVVDEIVVVDTGSSDETPEIALQHGAKLIRSDWVGDFSKARNLALENSTGRWILYIDADERVTEIEHDTFVEQLHNEKLAALMVKFRPSSGQTRYQEVRVFRNEPDIRFTGIIHETHLPDLWNHMLATGRHIEHTDFALDHLGYDGTQDNKHARNLPLLKTRLEMTPEHLFSWVHLGSTFKGLGDEEQAEQAWSRGLDLVRSKTATESQDCLPFLAMLRFREQKGLDISELLDEALKLFPDNLSLHWLDGCRLVSQKKYEEAIQVLEPFTAIDAKSYTDPVFAYDQKLFSVWVHDALGLCHFHLNHHADAAHHFAIAENAEPSRERKAKRLISAGRAARS